MATEKERLELSWRIVEDAEWRPNHVHTMPKSFPDGVGHGTAVQLCLLDLRERLGALEESVDRIAVLVTSGYRSFI